MFGGAFSPHVISFERAYTGKWEMEAKYVFGRISGHHEI
jgi:hypothetical protein